MTLIGESLVFSEICEDLSGPLASGGVRLNWRELRFGEARKVYEAIFSPP
jgi:hypothetical protein